LIRQIKNAWPNSLRAARFIPAVEYIQANRARTLLIDEMAKLPVDVYVTPTFGGDNLLLTNLTGHPSVVLPNGFSEKGTPTSITFMGRPFGEGALLAVANAYADATTSTRSTWPRFSRELPRYRLREPGHDRQVVVVVFGDEEAQVDQPQLEARRNDAHDARVAHGVETFDPTPARHANSATMAAIALL
jgi:hypothetical protein